MAKRTSFTSLLGGDGTDDDAEPQDGPQAPPTNVLMHTITGNPENPRQPEDYTDADEEFAHLKASMVEVGQLQPVAAISHDRYVHSKPQYAKQVKGAEWVVVGGNRRLAAARQLGWTRIDIRVQDRLEDDQIDDAVIIENIHRKQIDPIKEAAFLARMVDKHGSQEEVGRRIGKTQMYVSHRLALLKLDPEVKDELEAGTVKPSQVRGIASKSAEEQRAKVAAIKEQASKPKPPRKKKVAVATERQNAVLNPSYSGPTTGQGGEAPSAPGEGVQNGVLKPGAEPAQEPAGKSAQPEPEGAVQNAVLNDEQPAPAEGLPGQREEQGDDAPRWDPAWNQPDMLNSLIRERTKDPHFFTLVGHLLEQARERDPGALRKVLAEHDYAS